MENEYSLKELSYEMFKYQPLNKYILDSYNEMLMNGLENTLRENSLKYEANDASHLIEYRNATILKPSLGDVKSKGDKMYPYMARNDKMDYVAQIVIDIKCFRKEHGEEEYVLEREYDKQFLTFIPAMLGSSACWLSTISRNKEEGILSFADVNECDNDPLGYFIMNGTEKVLVTQEKLATNMIFTRMDKDQLVTEMRSAANDSSISLIKVFITQTKTTKYLSISLPFIKNKNKEMNVVNFIRLVEYLRGDNDSLNTAIQLFTTYMATVSPDERLASLNDFTIEDAKAFETDKDFITYILKNVGLATSRDDDDEEDEEDEEKTADAIDDDDDDDIQDITESNISTLRSEINRYFYPHIYKENFHSKYTVLAQMLITHMKTYFSYKPLSNRDHYGAKRLETPGTLTLMLFTKLFQNNNKDLEKEMKDKNDPKFRMFHSAFNRKKDKMWKEMRSSFVKESWGAKGNTKQKTGVSQVLSRLSIVAVYSYLRRIGTPQTKNSKASKPRMLDPTQWAVVCPFETPEGEACGLTKNLSVSTYITGQDDADQISDLLDLPNMDLDDPESSIHSDKLDGDSIISLNGAFIGYCNGEKIRNLLVNARRSGIIPRYTSITLAVESDQIETIKELRILSTLGRATRPLYIVENGKLLLDIKNMRDPKYSFHELLEAGVVEYIDVSESEYLLIAIDESSLSNGKSYTHMELNPAFIMGVASSIMTFPQHNPAPRVSYTAGMLKQFVGVTMTSYQTRADTGLKVLRYPQKSISHTKISEIIGLDEIPGSQNATVAIMTYGGYNQEDALIVNKGSLERGLFNSDTYDIYTVEAEKRQEFQTNEKYPDFEQGVIPLRRKTMIPVEKYIKNEKGENIGIRTSYVESKTGTENTPVYRGDVLATKITVTEKGDKIESNTYMASRKGVVDKIFRKNKGKSSNILRIRVRTSNVPEIGDKIMAPYSQKGVIGMILPEEDMPFDQNGVRPDIIINPHALPSRMTIGLLLDILVGKAVTCSNLNYSNTDIIPDSILTEPILPDIQGKTFNQLSTPQKQAFISLYKLNFLEPLTKGQDFSIPSDFASRTYTYKNLRPKVSDLPPSQQKAYNILHRQESRNTQAKVKSFTEASAFSSLDRQAIEQHLHSHGYQSQGYSRLMSGITGELIQARIYTGVCNYMALKHMVKEKFHARDTGKLQPINRQATRGKSKGGGIRFGEMERDIVIAHGAPTILQERLRDTTDLINTSACKSCGQFCYFDKDQSSHVCNVCLDDIQPTKLSVPFSLLILQNYWTAMGIKSTFSFDSSTDTLDIVRDQLKSSKSSRPHSHHHHHK